jgi:hypothetical protein
MTFALYHAAKSKQTWGHPLDGRLSRSAIEAVLGSRFSHDRQACARLVGWAEHALGPGIFNGIDQGKWLFITLPTPIGVDARASSTGEALGCLREASMPRWFTEIANEEGFIRRAGRQWRFTERLGRPSG